MVSKQIIDRCKQGERKAYQQCYELCAPYVYTIVKSYIYNLELRKDTMQEVFAQIFSSIKTYDDRKGSFKSWMGSIAVYQSIAVLKSSKKLSHLIPLENAHESIEGEKLNFEQVSKKEIDQLFSKMPSGYRTVFLLSVIDGYTHQEIASILDINEVTSRSQLSRAIKWVEKNLLSQTKKAIYG